MGEYYVDGELFHYGVKGMKWGKRRYQNKDGSLTPAGEKRYYDGDVKSARAAVKSASKAYDKSYSNAYRKSAAALSPFKKHRQANDERWDKAFDDAKALNEAKANLKTAKAQRKIERKLKSAGDAQGRADYFKDRGDEVEKKYTDMATAFDKRAKILDSNGKVIRAEMARQVANNWRESGKQARSEYDGLAKSYLARSEYQNKKATAIATKKNVDLGKMRVESILNDSRKKGYEYGKVEEAARKEQRELDRQMNSYEAKRRQTERRQSYNRG